MGYIADLHTHSRYSRACSPQLNIPNLVEWAKLKGIDVLGTSDFLHPLWFAELKRDLKEEGGFLVHKSSAIKFVLTVEVASIYTHKGKGRRVHNLIMMPGFASAEKFQKKLLEKRANIASDGRPIVGLSSKDLLALCLAVDEKMLFIPAHAWTPWFGVFGSESGYDSLQDCFEDLTPYVYGVETGVSSDPAMNWRVGELDSKSILSFSDAHSLPNLGRESTVLDADLSLGYAGLYQAVRDQRVKGTIEFYPEEGKYYYTGHRNCNIKYSPEDTKRKGSVCPVCGRGLTVGVMERVEALAIRENTELKLKNNQGIVKSETFPERAGYRMLVPLMQILSEALDAATTSQKVINEYKKLTTNLGGEIKILTKIDLGEVAKLSGEKVAEGISKDRSGDLVIDPGYDGVYGVVKIWNDQQKTPEKVEVSIPQLGLFD